MKVLRIALPAIIALGLVAGAQGRIPPEEPGAPTKVAKKQIVLSDLVKPGQRMVVPGIGLVNIPR